MVPPMAGQGFTLIEIIVVVSILGMVAFFGSNMLFTILKGSLKTKVMSEVKQDGSFAISTMERMIRNAKELVSCDTTILKIINPDDIENAIEKIITNKIDLKKRILLDVNVQRNNKQRLYKRIIHNHFFYFNIKLVLLECFGI